MRINNLSPSKITPYKQDNQRCNLAKFASFDSVSFTSRPQKSQGTIFSNIKNSLTHYNYNIAFRGKQEDSKKGIINTIAELLVSLKKEHSNQLLAFLRNKKIQELVNDEALRYQDLHNFATLEKKQFEQLQTLLNNDSILNSINERTIFIHDLYNFAQLEEIKFNQLLTLLNDKKIQKLMNNFIIDSHILYIFATMEENEFEQLRILLNDRQIQKLNDEDQLEMYFFKKIANFKKTQLEQMQTLINDEKILRLIDQNRIDCVDLCNFASLKKDKFKQLYILLNNEQIQELIQYIGQINGDDLFTFAKFEEDHFNTLITLLQRKGIKTQNANSIMNLVSVYTTINSDVNLNNLSFKEKMKLKEELDEIKNLLSIKDLLNEDEIAKINSFDEKLSKSLNSIITPTQVSDENIHNMMRGFFANNNPQLEKLLAKTDFSKYKKQGLPLKYPRQKFLEDLSAIFENLSQDKQDKIMNKLDISPIKNGFGEIIGYNGIINLNKLSDDETEGKVLSIATKFIKENSIITGNKDLDNALNSLIEGMPEFINVIGKQQHLTQQFSVDIHILTVLQKAMSNKNYQNLSNLDKTCLKFATILHDIAKSEGIIDKSHPEFSALYAKDILKKYKFPREIKDRIFELIKNHHWLEKYNKNQVSADYTASLFRHKDDYTIAKIMAEADLKGVSDEFYEYFSDALEEKRQMPIQNSLNKINSFGQLIFTSKIIRKDLIPKINYQGVDYKVIDFTKINQDTNLSKFGFAPEVTYDSLRLLFHGCNRAINLEAINALSNTENSSFLCSSYISLDNAMTFLNRKFGVSLEAENVNIANASDSNQTSGARKDFNLFVDVISDHSRLSIYRINLPSIIKKELELNDEEYIELYELIASKKYLSQIKDDKTYSIKRKRITGKKIKKAIQKAQDELFNKRENNEVNLYNPKINAFVARVNSIDKIPQDYLNFVQKYDLPIYILGEQ